MALAHHALVQGFGEVEDSLHLVLHHAAHRDAGPVGDDRGHRLLVDEGIDHALRRIDSFEFLDFHLKRGAHRRGGIAAFGNRLPQRFQFKHLVDVRQPHGYFCNFRLKPQPPDFFGRRRIRFGQQSGKLGFQSRNLVFYGLGCFRRQRLNDVVRRYRLPLGSLRDNALFGILGFDVGDQGIEFCLCLLGALATLGYAFAGGRDFLYLGEFGQPFPLKRQELSLGIGDFGHNLIDPVFIRRADVALAFERRQFLFTGFNQHALILDNRGRRGLGNGNPRAGGVEKADGLVRQLAGRDVAVRELHGGDHRLVGDHHLVVLLHGPQEPSQHVAAALDRRFADLDRLEAAAERRILLDMLAVFGPGRRGDGFQRATGKRRLQQIGGIARSRSTPSADQRVGLVDEQDDGGGRGLHFVDHRAQALLKFAFHRSSRLHQADIQRAKPVATQGRRNIARGDALGKAFDHRRLADTGLARQDRVILAAAHQHVDDLADFLVAADDGVHLSRLRFCREVDREAIQCRIALGARSTGLGAGRASGNSARAIHGPEIILVRSAPDFRVFVGQGFDIDPGKFLRHAFERTDQALVLQAGDQDVPGPDLGFAEHQGGEMPAAVQRVDHRRANPRHLGLVHGKTVDDRLRVEQQLGAVELEVIHRQNHVGAVHLQDAEYPVGQFKIAVAGVLGLAERLHERIITNAVEFSGYGF